MRISVVIPTYWTSSNQIIQSAPPDAIYDHPTPIESQSTLPRLLNSLKNTDLPKKSTNVIIIMAVTHHLLEERARKKTQEILKEYEDHFCIKYFSASTLRKMTSKKEELASLLSLYGYPNVRNIGLVVAQILGSNLLIFLDDDVVMNDRRYLHKAQEHVGENINGKILGGIAGYYVDEEDDYYLDINPRAWWKTGWPKERKMNEAFKIIESEERLTETSFAFGGNMILHWRMFEKVPFDPYISRGEDMDFLVNAKMLGFKFMLNTELKVLHLPGQMKCQWSEMRQDLYRFLYMREKMVYHKLLRNVEPIALEEFEPYPGFFLRPGTPLKFLAASYLHGLHSILKGDVEKFKGFMENICHIPYALRFAKKHRSDYFDFQKRWANHMPKIREDEGLTAVLKSQL